jgi:4-hydroxy-tetrahydrodipicolinate synthase
MLFSGVYTALVTPFANGKIDEKSFQNLIEWQINEGIHGLVPCGTTGESPTLSHEEHKRVVELCIEAARGRVKVIAGTGSNSTEEAIAFTRHAKQAGADGVLLVAPYYNKPTQEGLYQHYRAIHDAVEIPMIIYNIPGRSVINISDETLARLAKLPNIVGVKDATGDLARVSTLRQKAGKDFIQLSGEDMTVVGFNAMGGVGCISVTSNVAPKACAQVQEATLKGDFVRALELHDKMVSLHQVMFCETNPIPVKYALSLMGKCSGEIRLPLVPPATENAEKIRKVLAELSLI